MDLIMLEEILIMLITVSALIIIGYFLTKTLIKRYREKELQRRLWKVMKYLELKPCKKDYFSEKILALDSTNRVAVYLDYLTPETANLIQLEHLKECKLLVRGLVVRLDLIFNNANEDRFSIVFYRRFADPEGLRGSLTAKARRWHALFLQSIESCKNSDDDSIETYSKCGSLLKHVDLVN